MAKRFTDTDKWKKKFIRGLNSPYKLLWFYILDDCDHAGIWHVDIDVAKIKIGAVIDEKIAVQKFAGKILPFDNNEKWFIPDFIHFQYGELRENNRAHLSVINLLNKYELTKYLEGASMGLVSPLEGGKDKEQDKDMVKDKVKGKHLFLNSEFYQIELFRAKFQEEEKYLCFDLDHYHESIKNWSAEGKMKLDWIATAKNWMLRDLKENKAKLNEQFTKTNGWANWVNSPSEAGNISN